MRPIIRIEHKGDGGVTLSQFITNEALHKKTPQEITSLLYEACHNNLSSALAAINEKEYIDANLNLKKANDILHRLGGGLNYEAGIIADQLDALYNYMADKVIEANFEKNAEKVKEVIHILEQLMSAWNEALKNNIDVQPKAMKMKVNAYEQTSIYE